MSKKMLAVSEEDYKKMTKAAELFWKAYENKKLRKAIEKWVKEEKDDKNQTSIYKKEIQ